MNPILSPDQIKEILASVLTVLSATAPFLLTEVVTGAANELGKDALDKGRELFDKIRERFTQHGNAEASQTLELFVRNPKRQEKALAEILLEVLNAQPDFAVELRALTTDPSSQEIIARNSSYLDHITQVMTGTGMQRIASDNSTIKTVRQEKR
jgi:hypothetical protein